MPACKLAVVLAICVDYIQAVWHDGLLAVLSADGHTSLTAPRKLAGCHISTLF
jgi:hypothetical protein